MNNKSKKQEQYNNPVKAIFTGISDLFRKPENSLVIDDSDRLDGKKVLITGSSSGLGFASAIELAQRGAHVIMAVRSGIPGRGEEVKKRSGSDKVDMVQINLSDLSSLKDVAGEIKRRFGKMDIIICNAAMVAGKSRPINGLDEMFVVNYFAKFLMINHLIEQDCINTGGVALPRIIFVASESHRNPESIDWDAFGKYVSYGTKGSVALYGYNKLLLVTLVTELSRRLNKEGEVHYSVSSLCPGPVNTNIAREAPRVFQPLLKLVFRLFFRSPEKACKPVIYLAASPEAEGKTGEYLFLMQQKPVDDLAADPGNGKRLWELSEDLVKTLNL